MGDVFLYVSEMAVPEVDKRVLEQLEEMGFSVACGIRALHYSGELVILLQFCHFL